ncbi:MAG: peptidoglycan-binding domain-containing protein [Candidatus Paceibacterota bacterium]
MKKLSLFNGIVLFAVGLVAMTPLFTNKIFALTRAVDACPQAFILEDFSDNAPPTLAYVNNHTMTLRVGERYSGVDDGNSPERISQVLAKHNPKVSAIDSLPGGLSLAQKDITYASGQSIDAGPWKRSYVSGTPSATGETKVKIRADFTYNGMACSDTGYINFKILAKSTYTPPADPVFSPSQSTNGKIQFIKQALKNKQKDPNGEASIHNILAIKDKFVIDADCGQEPNMWIVKEDGSKILSSWHACRDSARGVWGDVYAGHGRISSALKLDWGNLISGAFIHEVQGGGQGGSLCLVKGPSGEAGDCAQWAPGAFNNAVYYQLNGSGGADSLGVSPDGVGSEFYNAGLAVLKNKVVASQGGRILTLPGWNKGNSVGLLLGPVVGYGDFLIQREGTNDTNGDWAAYSVSSDGAKTFVKKLGVKYSASYTYDNSVWPPRLAFIEYTDSKTPVTIKVFNQSGPTLAKTLTLPAGAISSGAIRLGGRASEKAYQVAVWGDYVLFVAPKVTGSYISAGGAALSTYKITLELWKDGQKVDSMVVLPDGFNTLNILEISQNGYVATRYEKDNAVYIFKLNVTSGGSLNNPAIPPNPNPNPNPATPGTCNASISFDKTSVAYGGSATETWAIDGADAGQVYGDCGGGATQISAGPKSYTFNNLTKTTTCRVYGKIGGEEKCTASATVIVGEKPAGNQTPTDGARDGNGTNSVDYVANSYTANAGSYDFGSTNLRQGSSGESVQNLQTFLNATTDSSLEVDGKMGPKTTAEVKTWQAENGLVSDGIVGPKTKEKMNAMAY